jgi:CHAT domain-containing protein
MFDASLGRVTSLPVARHALLADFVVLAGLGDFDEFASEAQMLVAGNIVRLLAAAGVQDFATVLFGAGSGVPVAAALEQQLGGFAAALGGADDGRVVRRITLCEIDTRKYASLRRAAVAVAARLSGPELRIVVDESDAGHGAARESAAMPARARSLRADPAYLVITLLDHGRAEHECHSALLTAGAKAAVLGGRVILSHRTLRAQLARAESGQLEPRDMAHFGDALARLLLPEPVRDGLATMRRRPLVVVHDGEGSRIPWETLRVGDVHPALAGGLTRRYASESLTVARWSQRQTAGTPLQVLMIINPTLDLPGAADEGAALARLLRAAGASVELIQGAAATRDAVLHAFGSGRHAVLHFAGHGFFAADDPGRSGLVCASGDVLRGADVTRLGELPALVFFNACEAARVRLPGHRARARRLFAFRRSTSVAEGYLAGGVANFLGTHWPVGDQAAFAFSTSFYQRLLQGAALGDCVLEARRRVLELGSIDWADYVLYGSPDFTVGRSDHD